MRIINLTGIAKNSVIILGLAVVTVLSVNAQNSNTGGSSSQMANSNTSQMANSNTGMSNRMANTTTVTTSNTAANTTRVESANTTRTEVTPRTEASVTPRTEVKTVVEKESSFPWGLLGLLGLAGLIPKKRSVEVTGVRETARETKTTTDNRDNNAR